MSPPEPAKRLCTFEDVLAAGDERAVEVIDGELVEKAAPGSDHGDAQVGVTLAVGGFRERGGSGGPGGWWLVAEVDVRYAPHPIYRHDMSGWRLERMPERPRERPVDLRPDWACEVLSPSNASNDTVRKLRQLHRHGVPHYWLVDPLLGTLQVMRWSEAGYLAVLNAVAGETVRAEPFESIEISISAILGR